MMRKPIPLAINPGQESVWDYPRPAIWQDTDVHIKVIFNELEIANTKTAKRVLETSHPPVYYLPPEDIKLEYLVETPRQTRCEWKGSCVYYNLRVGDKQVNQAAWCYTRPTSNFEPLKGYFAFYPRLMDACYVNDELVTPQPGNFYGGWITSDIVGPFKGEPGTMYW